MANQLVGTIPEFTVELDDWNVYYERLEQFFEVNEITPEKRSAFLISCIGSQAYKSLRDLCHPALPKDRPFEELCELLRKQFSPQVAIFRERTHFYNATQSVGENVTQWYGRLKKLSVDCKFGSNLEAVLLDKFITGLRPGQVLDRLCEENETLRLEQALDIAINKECAVKESAYLAPPSAPHYAAGGITVNCGRCVCGGARGAPSEDGSYCGDGQQQAAAPARGKGRPRNRRRNRGGNADDHSQAGD
uniref:Retrotransposon gag domain-containing protein n=1 Tax=Anopheles triannulatus TaxID=58253 RepID=A0A2M4A4E3_9DIPT